MKRAIGILLLSILFYGCEQPVDHYVIEESESDQVIEQPVQPQPEAQKPEDPQPEDPVKVLEEPEEEIIEEKIQEEEPETIPEPDYIIMYSLSGYNRAETIPWSDDYDSYPFVINNLHKIIQIGVEVDYKDFFLFYNGNTQNFFGFDLMNMTRQELDWMAEVLQRYPEESIWVLQEEWYGKEID